MRALKFSALFAAIVLTAPAAALAADAVRPFVPPPPGGWYFRADLGYKWYGTPDAIFDGADISDRATSCRATANCSTKR